MRRLIPFGVVLIMLLAGCLPQPFKPNGSEATDARTDAWPTVDRTVESILDRSQSAEPLGTARMDGCREGQHNWKIKDKYQWQCYVERLTVVPAADTEVGVGRALLAMDAALQGLGCTTTSTRGPKPTAPRCSG